MGSFVLTNAFVNFGGRDITGFLNQVALNHEVELQEDTAFGDSFRTRVAGARTCGMDMSGHWDSASATDSLDKDLFDEIGANRKLVSISAEGAALGDTGFFFEARQANYVPGADYGNIFAFALRAEGDGRLYRGSVMEKSIFTVTVNGTNRQVGALSATQTMYSAVHVTAVSGTSPTLDVTVESDEDGVFGTPLLRMTHPQFTGVGSDLQSVAGAVTDDFWRLVMTITGSSPSFTILGTLAII